METLDSPNNILNVFCQARAVREILNDDHPEVFGYGMLYNSKDHKDAYQVITLNLNYVAQ